MVTVALCSQHFSFEKTLLILHDLLGQHHEGPLDIMTSEAIREVIPCPATEK